MPVPSLPESSLSEAADTSVALFACLRVTATGSAVSHHIGENLTQRLRLALPVLRLYHHWQFVADSDSDTLPMAL